MTKEGSTRNLPLRAAVAALVLSGCASVSYRGYPDGGLEYSNVRYDYTAEPHLKEGSGKTFEIRADESMAGVTQIPALENRGLRPVASGGDLVVQLNGGAVTQEPGSFGLGGSYKPALIVRQPVRIAVKRGRDTLVERSFQHEEALGVPGAKSFKTREEAKAAMASLSGFTAPGAQKKAREGAARKAVTTMQLVAKDLFEPRAVSVTLPAIRSAGDVDMEDAYTLLAAAKDESQVASALAAYQGLGTEHTKADGSPDVVANYGVLVGTASAKVLAGDLTGAWSDTKRAWQAYPRGEEHGAVAQVLIKKQEETGVKFIPEEDMEEMNMAPAKAMQDLLRLMGGEKKE